MYSIFTHIKNRVLSYIKSTKLMQKEQNKLYSGIQKGQNRCSNSDLFCRVVPLPHSVE
jgi:hypothetical protein